MTAGMLPAAMRTPRIAKNTRCVSSASANISSGATTSATSSFAVTVSASDTGRDFQKRMLRSLRSAYRQSSV